MNCCNLSIFVVVYTYIIAECHPHFDKWVYGENQCNETGSWMMVIVLWMLDITSYSKNRVYMTRVSILNLGPRPCSIVDVPELPCICHCGTSVWQHLTGVSVFAWMTLYSGRGFKSQPVSPILLWQALCHMAYCVNHGHIRRDIVTSVLQTT
jgi:hypothetical protein